MKIKLKELIGNYLSSAEQSSQEFLRLWNMGVKGMQLEFNLDVTGEVKTVLLDVNANKTVNLPCDYISYSKIGVLNERGEVVTFKRNDQLAKINADSNNRLDKVPVSDGFPANPILLSPYYPGLYFNYLIGDAYFNLYGAKSGTVSIGEYTLDEDNRIIYLGIDWAYKSQIVLEYLSDGYEQNLDDYKIDVRAGEAMIAYIRWNDAKDARKKFSREDVRQLKIDYYREKRLAKTRINGFKLNEMEHATRVATNLTAKA